MAPNPRALEGYDFADLAQKTQRLLSNHFAAVCSQKNGTEQVLARNVARFQLTDEDNDPSVYPLQNRFQSFATPPGRDQAKLPLPCRGSSSSLIGE